MGDVSADRSQARPQDLPPALALPLRHRTRWLQSLLQMLAPTAWRWLQHRHRSASGLRDRSMAPPARAPGRLPRPARQVQVLGGGQTMKNIYVTAHFSVG